MTIVNNTNNYHEHCQSTIYNIYNIYNKNSNMRERVIIIDSSVYILFVYSLIYKYIYLIRTDIFADTVVTSQCTRQTDTETQV